jgi:hypothetical protein
MAITYDQAGVTYDSTLYTYNGEPFSPSVFPVAGVYIAFTDGPYTATPAWTEVTTYVRSITTHRGRSSDLDQFDTGTAQIVLDNRDRRFDPFYTSGPYYPNGLTPRRPIRIVGQIGGQTYEVFRGFVAGWPVTWSEAGKDSTVTIQCFDALGLMANEVVPTDWADFYTRAQSPTVYFKGNDSQGTAIIRDAISNGVKTMTNANSATNPNFFEAPNITPGAPSTSVFCASYVGSDLTSTPTPAGAIAGDYPIMSLSVWLKATGTTAQGYNQIRVSNNGGRVSVYYTASSIRLTFSRFGISGTPNLDIDAAYVPNTGQAFHIFLIVNNSTSPTVYINGRAATYTSAVGGAGSGGLWPLQVQANFANFQELAVWERVNFTAADVAAIYNAGAARFSESTTARMQRLLDTTDWPAALESFPASPVGTVAEIGSGTGVVPELQLVADSEGGELYVSKTGVLTMTARRDVFNATRSAVSQATFTDSGVGIRYGTELNIEYDADNLKNDITVNYSGDGEVNLYSDAVITGYGAAATTIETQLDSPTSALDLATLELGVEGVLVPQISPIDVSPNTAAADWQTILGLELLDRVTFKRTPTVGNQFDRAALINAIDHQIEPGVWRTQLTLSMRYTSPLTLNDPVLGRLDYNYLG